MTEILFDEALRRASELDAHVASTGTTFGPLHGVPVTLKDQFNVRGVDTTLGYVGRSFKPALDDAVLVKMLRALGAVIIAKTNLPQSIMVRALGRFRCLRRLLTTSLSPSGARLIIRSGVSRRTPPTKATLLEGQPVARLSSLPPEPPCWAGVPTLAEASASRLT